MARGLRPGPMGGAVAASEPFTTPGPAGALAVRAHGPTDGAPVVLCHPHPLHGGTMGSRLVYDLARGLAEAGLRTYRFDFRGVGKSEGVYGAGVGELEDAMAVVDAVEARHGRLPALVGHSFGGAVALRVATTRDLPLVVAVGTPAKGVRDTRLSPLEDAPRVWGPALLVYGSEDDHVPRGDPARLAAALPEARLEILDGAGHFLEPSHNPRALAVIEPAVRAALLTGPATR